MFFRMAQPVRVRSLTTLPFSQAEKKRVSPRPMDDGDHGPVEISCRFYGLRTTNQERES
jgi:hypothetical protein